MYINRELYNITFGGSGWLPQTPLIGTIDKLVGKFLRGKNNSHKERDTLAWCSHSCESLISLLHITEFNHLSYYWGAFVI